MVDAIIVIAQYARDQAVVSARDQALACTCMDHAVWITENTYIRLESSKNGKIVYDHHSVLAR